MWRRPLTVAGLLLLVLGGACGGGTETETAPSSAPIQVLAAETVLADIAQNVAGQRLTVQVLLPSGADPHSYQPTPSDLARVAESDVLIVNGAGLEAFVQDQLRSVGGQRMVLEAATGLVSRQPKEGEGAEPHAHGEADPHFWLDPQNVIRYVENIRDGLSEADPGGAEEYAANAQTYIRQLRELDSWIAALVSELPPERRLLVTNHESFGYFADRYGFRIVGAIIPSVSSAAAPSALQLALLVDRIRESGVRAIFLETGSNPELAEQLGRETGVKVVTGLYTHSIGAPVGDASTYIEMMRHNASAIVEALR